MHHHLRHSRRRSLHRSYCPRTWGRDQQRTSARTRGAGRPPCRPAASARTRRRRSDHRHSERWTRPERGMSLCGRDTSSSCPPNISPLPIQHTASSLDSESDNKSTWFLSTQQLLIYEFCLSVCLSRSGIVSCHMIGLPWGAEIVISKQITMMTISSAHGRNCHHRHYCPIILVLWVSNIILAKFRQGPLRGH